AAAHDLNIPWTQIFFIAGGITVLSLLHYAYRMRYAERSGGRVLGATTAASLALAVLWVLTQAYQSIAPPGFTVTWQITSIVAAAGPAVPAVVRFIPILAKPGVRQAVLKVPLVLAGFIVPIGAIVLAFWFYHLGSQASVADLPDNPLQAVPGWVLL